MSRSRSWCALLTAALVAIICAGLASAAAADVTQSDWVVKVTLDGAVTRDAGILSGARAPVFKIEVKVAGTTIQCHMNFDADGPCGTRQTVGCPTYQCWTYTASVADGDNLFYVDYAVPEQGSSYEEMVFDTYAEPPHTTLQVPLEANERYSGAQSFERPVFVIDDPDRNPLPIKPECTLSAPAATPGPWGSCRSPRLRLTGVYRLRVRTVDVFGRTDAVPVQYVFSPTPCRARVRGGIPSYAQIRGHGLALAITCIQPTRFAAGLTVPYAWAFPCHGQESTTLGYVRGRTRRTDQTLQLTLRALRCAPSPAAHTTRIPVKLQTVPQSLYGATQSRGYRLRP